MKIKNPKNSILLLLAVGALVLSGCSGDSDEKNGGALVTSISVAGVSVTTVPGAIPKSDWDNPDFDLFNLETSQVGQVVINDADLLTEAQIVVAASAGAKVKYAAVEFDPPETFQDASKLTLFNNGYLCIQVTSEDGKSVNYYVVEIRLSNTLTSLNKVTVGGIDATALGTPNADWSAATAGSVGLSAATKDNAAVTVTKANANQTVKYAKVTGSAAPTFGDTATFSFNDGDFLYLEVTAENGVNKTVYKLEVQVGRDTTLSALSIGEVEVVTRGTSAAALADVTPGTVLFSTRQPGGGYAVSVTPTDTDASVKWAAVENNDPNTAAFGTTSPLVFTDQGYLYVEVTAANGTTKAYYKIQVNLMMTATINYGKPVIKASSEKYIDAAWEDVTETYYIAKVATESSESYKADPTTTGIAKALFDETGLYLYVEVTDPAVDTAGTSAHEKDSVELFINEGVDESGGLIKDPVGYADKGGQYRVDAEGAISGDPAAASDAVDASKVSAWATETGYIVIFQAPWRFLNLYPLNDHKKIGFELQINACSEGGRNGVVVWNNIAHTNYQNVTDYGEANLELNGNTLKVNARDPIISANPAGKAYTPPLPSAADALIVTATSPDGGTLTYQWYSNTVNSYEGGAAISAQTGISYTPPLTNGTTYYWVTVTNAITDNGDGGTKTATVPSGIASIVVSTVELFEKIVAGSCSVPVYRFTLPDGKTWSDYKEMTYTVLIGDETTLSFTGNQIRSHIVGNYALADFGSTGELGKQSGWGDDRIEIIANNVGISNIVGADYQAYTWKKLTYDITTPDSSCPLLPTSDAVGPFYLGIGFAVNESNLADGAVTYYVKDVALIGTDDSLLPADPLDTVDGALTLSQLKVKFQAGPGVTRTMEALPTAP